MERVFYNPRQVLIGSVFLLLGLAVYLFSRPAWQFTLLPDFLFIQWFPSNKFGHYGDSLPSFLHVFGFSVLCAGIIAISKKAYIVICSLWALINILFEMLQSDLFLSINEVTFFGKQLSAYVLNWLQNYTLNAVFDYYDILAILLGAMSAYWVLTQTQQREVEHGHVKT